jgi:N utilization substance protein B
MFSRRFLRIKVVKALYAHQTGAADTVTIEEKELLKGLDKDYDLYHYVLSLIAEVKRYAEERIEIARNKHLPTAEDLNPNLKFVTNEVVARIEADAELDHILAIRKLGWAAYPELIKHLYVKMTESEYYKAYMASEGRSFAEDRRLVEEFYIQTVQDDEMLCSILEENSLTWGDAIDFVLIMVLRTLGGMKASQEKLPLQPQFKSDEDRAFVRRLFAEAVVGYKENLATVEQFTNNWDVERIAVMDNVIMTTALAELLNFDSIPVKVTLDEYIEIAKYYSTMGSSTFINGILDKIVEQLTAEGKINKSGRGLVEI